MPNAHIANKSLQLGGGECRKKDRMREKITLKVVIIKKMFTPPQLHPNFNWFNSFELQYMLKIGFVKIT